MGSSQSSPADTPPPARQNSEPRSRLSTFRRFSSFARRDRRDSNAVKRERQSSSDGVNGEKKKRRVEDVDGDEAGEGSAAASLQHTLTSSAGTSALTASELFPIPSTSSPAPNEESVPLGAAQPSTPPPADDPLLPERLRSLSTIRDALGPEWPAPDTAPPAVNRILRRLRGQSLPPDTNAEQTMSSRLTAFLGFSSLAPPSTPAPSLPQDPAPESADSSHMTVEELTERLERTREDLAETQRLLNVTQARIDAANRRRIPQGAVLVIQGLAQTHTLDDAASEGATQPSANSETRPRMPRLRRSSESSAQAPRTNEHNGASLEAQARMIGGLLTYVLIVDSGLTCI